MVTIAVTICTAQTNAVSIIANVILAAPGMIDGHVVLNVDETARYHSQSHRVIACKINGRKNDRANDPSEKYNKNRSKADNRQPSGVPVFVNRQSLSPVLFLR